MIVRAISGLGLCAAIAAPALAQEAPGGVWTARDLHALTCCSRALTDARWIVSEAPSSPLLGGELHSSSAYSATPAGDFTAEAMNVSLRYPVGRSYLQGVLGAASAGGAGVTRTVEAGEHMYIGQRRLFHREVSVGYRLSRHWGVEAAYVRTSSAQRLQNLEYPGSNSVGLRLAFRIRR
jgi:hypothetical protein